MLERPPGPFRVNQSHPLYNSLGLLVAPQGDNFTNLLVPGQMGVKAAGSSLSTATVPILGQCLKSAGGAASGVKFTTAATASKLGGGVMFMCVQFTDATSTSSLFATSTASSGMRFDVATGNLATVATGVTSATSSGLSLTTGIPYFIAASFDDGATNWLVRNLASGNTVTSSGGAVSATTGDQTYVVAGRISSTTGLNGYVGLAGFIPTGAAGRLGRSALRTLADDPWGLIRPDGYRRNYFTSAPAGGTVTAVGSSTGTSTVQATSAATSAQVASSTCAATAQATGASTSAQVAFAAGTVLTADFIGASTSAQVGSASGSTTVADFINGTATLVTAVGSANGVATVLGISQPLGGALPTGRAPKKKLPYGWWEDRDPVEIERAIVRAEDAVQAAEEAITAPRQERRDAQAELNAALAQIELDASIERLASLQAKQARAKLESIAREVATQRKEFERMRADFEEEKKRRARMARLKDDDDALAVLLG